jgi:hypothetical protein
MFAIFSTETASDALVLPRAFSVSRGTAHVGVATRSEIDRMLALMRAPVDEGPD